MNKYHILIWLLLLMINSLKAQDIKRTSNWYFGNGAGLMFNTNPPELWQQ